MYFHRLDLNVYVWKKWAITPIIKQLKIYILIKWTISQCTENMWKKKEELPVEDI